MTPFVSLTDLAAYLKVSTIAGTDLLAVASLDAACQAIRTYTNQDLNLVRHDTVKLHGNKYRDLLLPQLPVLEVHSVDITDSGGDITELAVTDWFLGEAGILYRTSSPRYWPPGIGNIEVEYTHGWGIVEADLEESDEPTADRMPSDLRMIALRIAASLYQHPPSGTKQLTLGSYSETFTTAAAELIEPAMEAILNRYVVKT